MGNLFKKDRTDYRCTPMGVAFPELVGMGDEKIPIEKTDAVEFTAIPSEKEQKDRVPHIEIGKAIIDATDKVREGLSKSESPSEIDAYVDILSKIDEMHWKNTEKVTLFAQ